MYVGVDEVGRGPVAGPVTVCAFKVPKGFKMSFLRGITDSKKLSKKRREEWSKKLHLARKEGKLDFRISSVSAREIDQIGISRAIKRAVTKSLKDFSSGADVCLDGLLRAPKRFKKQKTIIGGDGKNKLISSASVLAKVHRDSLMRRYSKKYPKYGFDVHAGYGTKKHLDAIKRHGLCREHRRCFLRTKK